MLQSWAPSESLVLRRNESYWQGASAAERLIFHIQGDATERFARLLEGGLDVAPLDASQLTSVQANPAISVFGANIDGYDFIALNLANPENPQPGTDAAGNRLVQEPHPVLAGIHSGDYVVVRRQPTAQNGEIVVIGIPGEEATVKTFSKDGNKITLTAANPEFDPMVFGADEVDLFGKVVTVLRAL